MLYSGFSIFPRSVVRRQTGFAARITWTSCRLNSKSTMSSLQLTHETYAEFIAENQFAAIHFWSQPNSWDRTLRAAIAELSPNYPKIALAEFCVDRPEHWEICVGLRVTAVPFLALFSDGLLRTSHAGQMGQEELRDFVDDFWNSNG